MIQYQNQSMTVFQSALYQTTSTVVQTKDLVLVVDPTWLPQEIDEIKNFVMTIKGERPIYLLFTHADFDHIIGYKAFPEAITIGSKEMENHPEKGSVIEQIEEFDSRYYVHRDYPIKYPKLDIVIKHEGETVNIGETQLTFYSAPGHTPDGLFTVIEALGLLIAGDYLSNVEFPYLYHSSLAYEETMNKVEVILEDHSICLLVPGHGQVTDDVLEMRARIESSLAYIHALRDAVSKDEQSKLAVMINDYPFPKTMKSFHDHNQSLIREELNLKRID